MVLVDVKLEGLDINQCPAEEHVNNAFKNTAKCHYESQYVSFKYIFKENNPFKRFATLVKRGFF